MLVTTPLVPAALGRARLGHPRRRAARHLGLDHHGADPAVHLHASTRCSAIVLLASTYIGAEYGGSIPAILIRTPGTNSAAATVIDGYEMKRQGRAGEALGISLWSGVVGSLFGPRDADPDDRAPVAPGAAVQADLLLRARRARASASSPRCPSARCSKGLAAAARRHDDRDGRHRSDLRRQPLHLRLAGAACRHEADPRHGRPVRGQRAAAPVGRRRISIGDGRPDPRAPAELPHHAQDRARRRRSAASSAPSKA